MDEQPETVYEVLKEHLKDVFDDDTRDSMENRWKPTIYEQSYDEAKEIFRFDANPSGKLFFRHFEGKSSISQLSVIVIVK